MSLLMILHLEMSCVDDGGARWRKGFSTILGAAASAASPYRMKIDRWKRNP